MNKDQIAVSLMCMDFLKIKEQLEVLNESVGMYHIDIMDGHFCKNITLSPDLIKSFKKVSKLPMDVHLMTTEPNDWIETVAEAGADIYILGGSGLFSIDSDIHKAVEIMKHNFDEAIG